MQTRKVKLIHGSRVGVKPDGSPWVQECGAVIELPIAEAAALIEAQQAEAVAEMKFPETSGRRK